MNNYNRFNVLLNLNSNQLEVTDDNSDGNDIIVELDDWKQFVKAVIEADERIANAST